MQASLTLEDTGILEHLAIAASSRKGTNYWWLITQGNGHTPLFCLYTRTYNIPWIGVKMAAVEKMIESDR